jgi:hypothetical protein
MRKDTDIHVAAAPSVWTYAANGSGRPMTAARTLSKRGFQKRSLQIGSQKMNAAMFVEYEAEAAVALALDIDPRVQAFFPQPFTLRTDLAQVFDTREAATSARPRAMSRQTQDAAAAAGLLEVIYTPDFEVELQDDPVSLVIECKRERDVGDAERFTQSRRSILRDLGFRYILVNASAIDVPAFTSNVRQVRDALRHLKQHASDDARSRMLSALTTVPQKFTAGDLRAAGAADTDLHIAVALGMVAYDLMGGPLTVTTPMWLAEGDLRHRQLLSFEI